MEIKEVYDRDFDSRITRDVEEAFEHFMKSETFSYKVAAYTRRTVKEILGYLATIAIPLIVIIVGLGVYIFQNTNQNMEKLTTAVISLEKATAQFSGTLSVISTHMKFIDERTKENKKLINGLLQLSNRERYNEKNN